MSVTYLKTLAMSCALITACTQFDGALISDAGPPIGGVGPVGGVGSPMTGGWTPTDDPAPTVTPQMLDTALLLRVFPNTMIPIENEVRYVYCTAVPVSNAVLTVPAECVKRGVAYGQVFQGEEVDFTQNPRSVSRVTTVFTHPEYEAQTSTDLALLWVDPPLSSQVTTFSRLENAQVSAFVRVGYIRDPLNSDRFQRVSHVGPPSNVFASELLFGLGAAESCAVPGGGVLFPISDGNVGVVGVSARGDADCSKSGVSIRLDANRDFLLSTANTPSLPGGYSGEVLPSLTCGQTLLCEGDTVCEGQVHPEHQDLRDALFVCKFDEENAPCEQPACYESEELCGAQYLACLNAPSLASPQGGFEAGTMAGTMAGGAGAEGGAGVEGGSNGGGMDVAGAETAGTSEPAPGGM